MLSLCPFQIIWRLCHFLKGSVVQEQLKAIFFLQIQIEMWLSISRLLYSGNTLFAPIQNHLKRELRCI